MDKIRINTHVGRSIIDEHPWINTTLRTEGGFINIRLIPDEGKWLVAYEIVTTRTVPIFVKVVNLEGIFYNDFKDAQRAYSLRKRLLRCKLELGLIKF